MFGGGISDWTMQLDGSNDVFATSGAVLTFWDSRNGGTRYLDLQDIAGAAVTSVSSSTGADGQAVGQIPPFYGPDGVFELWAQAGSGPRSLMSPINLGSYLGPVRSQLEAHVSPAVPNPHLTTLASLTDVTGGAAGVPGQLLGVDGSGLWAPVTVAGVGGTVQVTGNQTVAGTKTFEQPAAPAASRIVVNAAEAQSVDVLQAWSSAAAGQAGVKVKTTSLNEKGELRVSAAKADSIPVRVTGQVGQTANLLEQVNSSGTVLARMEANGSWRAPNLGRTVSITRSGTLTVAAGTFIWTNDTGTPLSIRSVRARVVTAPTGASILVDVNVNGTTIFTTQANRPSIAASQTASAKNTGFSVNVIPDGATVTVDVDQIGSTVAGAELHVQIEVW
jgi:hypothetical protein